jgi:lipopolysaccharide/colanic/teichoic acid biosynthesis glycosyltransferase
MDFTLALVALVVAGPLMLLVALLLRIQSNGPVLFRQTRLGRNGHPFELLKFRTMSHGSTGAGVTRRGDARVTPTGRWLRAFKLDELPQFINVLRGDMSLVGPRPDLEQFWSLASSSGRQVLSLQPGITGAASLAFRNEEELLAHVDARDLSYFYIQNLLPRKARLDLAYAARATFLSDCSILLKTAMIVFRRHAVSAAILAEYEQVPR